MFLSLCDDAFAKENTLGFSLTVGSTIDVAPFGIEQQFFTLQIGYLIPAPISLGFKSSFVFNKSSRVVRVPLIIKVDMITVKDKQLNIAGYGGTGVEFYRSEEYKTNSPLLTVGVALTVGYLYTDISVSQALRDFNTDSDISVTAGICF